MLVVIGHNIVAALVTSLIRQSGQSWQGIFEAAPDPTDDTGAELPFFSKNTQNLIPRFLSDTRLLQQHPATTDLVKRLLSFDPKTSDESDFELSSLSINSSAFRDSMNENLGSFTATTKMLWLDEKRIGFFGGGEIEYQAVFWCAGIHRLSELVRNSPNFLSESWPEPTAGRCVEVVVQLNSTNNFHVPSCFEFRFKDNRIPVLKMMRSTDNPHAHYYAEIPRAAIDDAEEQAKLIRALKREIQRQDSAKSSFLKIVYHPRSLIAPPKRISRQEIARNFFYCGNDLTDSSAPPLARNFEVALFNTHRALLSIGLWH